MVRRLSRARKAPRDAVMRARMVELSWAGLRVPAIAQELGCGQKTVRRWLHRFNRFGLEGLEDLGGQGRKRRITEAERSRIIALVKQVPPGRLEVQPGRDLWAADESGPAEWTPDSLAARARQLGIEVGRSQVRRDPDRRGRAPAPHSLLDPLEGPRLHGKRTRIIGLYTQPPDGATVICADELGPVIPRTFAPAPGWSPDGHRIKSEIDYSRGPEKTRVYGALRVRDCRQITMATSSRNSVSYQQFLQLVEDANPTGEIWIATDNPFLPQQPVHPDLAGRPPPDPPHAHPGRRVPAEPAGRSVADLPQDRPGRTVLGQPRRHHAGHRPGHPPTQRPSHTPDPGSTSPVHPPTTTPISVHPMRNPALAPHMLERKSGRIIAIASGAARHGVQGMAD
ncbi:helix-turn-helix domain-containing protein [Streptomyces sp. NPDC058001]|uniref:helix-turn-helix domain-containing protein n=1 Tax=Streptomyces sp. NPDC058001 TaxID=3346300 RepID=UPI0036E3A77A